MGQEPIFGHQRIRYGVRTTDGIPASEVGFTSEAHLVHEGLDLIMGADGDLILDVLVEPVVARSVKIDDGGRSIAVDDPILTGGRHGRKLDDRGRGV